MKLKGIDKEFSEQAYIYVQKDIKPNSRLNLALYNMFNTKNGKYRTDRIRNIGEPPHILDSLLVEVSRNEVEKFLKTKGFLKAEVKSEVVKKNKRAYITLSAKQGPSFKLRNYTYQIPDSNVKRLYENARSQFTKISPGMRYDADSLLYESKQVFELLKRNGYYDYQQQYMRGFADSNLYSSQVDVKMVIDNPVNRGQHQVFSIGRTRFIIENSEGRLARREADSAYIDTNLFFKDYSGRFKFRPLAKYVFFNKGDIYNTDNVNLTYDRLFDLNVFKNIRIDFVKDKVDTTILNVRLNALPIKRMSNRIEGEYTFNTGRNGFNIANTYTNRNLFGGSEQLDIKFKYGILFDSRIKGNLIDKIFNRDFQIGVNVIIPKLLIPFRIPSMGRYGVPKTTLSSSVQLFNQVNAFTNRLFINSITYNWAETRLKLHSLTPVNIEYRDGRLDPAFKDSLEAKQLFLYVATNNRQYFNLGSQYSYALNALKLNTYENFLFLRSFFDVGGNTLSLFANALKLKKDSTGARTFLGLPYLQYFKTELDLRLYRSLGSERQFVARLYPGIAYPYGNKSAIPFEKNFYAGGSTGIRAWQARTLGPGNYNRKDIEQGLRERLRNLDQLGEIKLEGSLEYRFKLLNNFFGSKVRGAAFTDFGNVWRLNKLENLPDTDVQFRLNKLFQQLAIGVGAGLRFDLQYFVFRFDAGIKVKDPQFEETDQWVIKHLFNGREFRRNYAATNFPDQYRFVQYNFGVGMPF